MRTAATLRRIPVETKFSSLTQNSNVPTPLVEPKFREKIPDIFDFCIEQCFKKLIYLGTFLAKTARDFKD
jgi:hypothetical protein